MSGVRGHDGKRITHTAAYLLKCPASSVPQAMRACKYSDDKESSNAAKQMAVRRAWKAALKKKKKKPPPLSNLRVVPGIVCVPNYWVVRHSQQVHLIQNPHHTCIYPNNSRK